MITTLNKTVDQRTLQSVTTSLKPSLRLTVSAWADKHRILNDRYTSEPGPWRTARTPYLREIMDSFRDGSVGRITFVKSSRVGGTEAMNNMLLYSMDENPAPTLYVLPTEDGANEECTTRLKSMVQDCARVSRHINKKAWATADKIELATMRVSMAWAASPVTLTRRTVRDVFFDELDNCEVQAGKLGQNAELASDRNTTYGHRATMVSVSTPSITGAAAWQQWLDSDMRQYHVPCPYCGEYQLLSFDSIKVPEGQRNSDEIEALELAWYECKLCQTKLIDAEHKSWMVARGVWLSKTQTIAEPLPIKNKKTVENAAEGTWKPKIKGKRPITRRIGFHIWSAYSPWRTWSQIIAKFFRDKDDPEKLQVFVNSWLGQPWKEAIEEIDESKFGLKRHGALKKDLVPEYVDTLVMGADVQVDHIWYVIRGYGEQRRSHLIRAGMVGDFYDLYEILLKGYERTDGKILNPVLCAIDSGYRTFEVYDFAKTHAGVFPTKGMDGQIVPVRPTPIEYVTAQQRLSSIKLYKVDTHYFKEMLYRYAKIDLGEPCSFALNADASDDYCKQFTSEHQTWVTRKGKKSTRRVLTWETKTPNAKNHYLDCEVYALAIIYYKKLLAQTMARVVKKKQPRKRRSSLIQRHLPPIARM